MKEFITAITFSRRKISVLSGFARPGKVYVLKALSSPLLPATKDGFMEKEEAEQALTSLLSETKNELGGSLSVTLALLPAIDYSVYRGENTSTLVSDTVTQHDFINIANMIRKSAKVDNKTIFYCDPLFFTPEGGEKSRKFPLGTKTSSLAMQADMHMIHQNAYRFYEDICKSCGLDLSFTALSCFASSSYLSLFSSPERYSLLSLEEDQCEVASLTGGHLASASNIPYGLEDMNEKASSLLSLSPAKTREYARLFGLRKKTGFPYQTPEGKTLEEISQAFEESLSPLVEEIAKQLKDDSPIIFVGKGANMEGLDQFFSNRLGKKVYLFNGASLGARESGYLPCLGGIALSSYPYQTKKNSFASDSLYLTKNRFSRGE
ncbi:MAG: hypothetical protein PUA93_06590 [Eubacteriales bacterium]|nr:hypothetical protein [Eubacteriales bacterium]